jgi:4-hydroxybenzoate polyprenyltransferase
MSWLAIGGCGALMLGLLVWAGRRAGLHWPYMVSLAAVGLLFLYQMTRVRMGADRETTFRLFQAHVGVGMVVLLGIELDYAITYMMIR